MRSLAIAIAGVWMGGSTLAHADPGVTAGELQARGEELARIGRFSDAIDTFKEADRLEVRASHACLIALAYTRREMWSQAEIFMARCHALANEADPLPTWVAKADRQIAERLMQATVAAVEIRVEPTGVAAKITVSSFAPDETFEPRTIHLPPGHHVIIASAPGFEPGRREIDIGDKALQQVVIHLDPVGSHAAAAVARAPRPVERDPLPRRLLVAGGVTIGLAAVVNATLYLRYRNKLDAAATPADYDRYESRYDVTRITMFGLYGLGGAVLIAGAIRHYQHRDREAAVVSVAPIRGGGFVALEWRR